MSGEVSAFAISTEMRPQIRSSTFHHFAPEAKTPGAAVVVEVISVTQLLKVAGVDLVPLALEVWPVLTACVGTFIPIEAKPPQSVVDHLHCFGSIARCIGILDAQDELAAGMAGEEPIEESRPRAADVQVASGRRSESDADRSGHGAAEGG
jgi:hypothetical protein